MITPPPRRETLAEWKRLCQIAIEQRDTYAAKVKKLEAELALQREILARYHQDNCKPRHAP